jgi:pimeloyl-ACP methyl ester carboxylesterase
MPTKPSIVFCHGIWADGSSFSKVIPPLQAEGYDVMAAQYGLDTPEGDVATVKRTLGRVGSPAILVGHSYGGSVITAAGTDERVAGLVYIAALAPDANETSQSQQESIPSQTCSSTSKSPTDASGCGRKVSPASPEIFRHKSRRSSGPLTMRRLPTCSAGMRLGPRGSRSRLGTSWPTTTGRFSPICNASSRSAWEPPPELSTAATSRCCLNPASWST